MSSENRRLLGRVKLMAGKESEKTTLILLVAIVVIIVVGAFSMVGMMGWYGGRGMMGRGMMNGSGLGYGWWMPLGGVVFLTILIVGLYLLFSAYHKPERSSGSGPIEILKGRYAKGEITGEQYQKMKKELE
jgi:putative membrane protein